jgi:hypothetical protein
MKLTLGVIACLAIASWMGGCGSSTLGGGTLAGSGGSISLAGAGGAAGGGSDTGGIGGSGAGSGPGSGGLAGAGPSRGGTFGGGRDGGPSDAGDPTTCPLPSPPFCPGLCGNGRRDVCLRPVPLDCHLVSFAEDCDGDDFGGDSCAARGFGSGKLACSSSCTMQPDSCSECMPRDSTLLSCGPSPIAFPMVAAFGLAGTDDEIGLALLGYPALSTVPSLVFARLSPSLTVTSAVTLDDASRPGPLQSPSLGGIAIASLRSGWVVAVCARPAIYVYTLDRTGKPMALAVLPGSSDPIVGCAAGTVALAARPAGNPLLVWMAADGVNATLIADDALPVSTPAQIISSVPINWETIGAAWVADAFHVVVPIEVPSGATTARALRLMRITADGTPSFVADLPAGQDAGQPSVAVGGADVRIVYRGLRPGAVPPNDRGVVWQRVSPSGELLSPDALIGAFPFFARSPAFAFGDDTVVLLGSYDGTKLAITRVASDGRVVVPATDIARTLNSPLGTYDMVRRGPEVVVAWTKGGQGLGLARVVP